MTNNNNNEAENVQTCKSCQEAYENVAAIIMLSEQEKIKQTAKKYIAPKANSLVVDIGTVSDAYMRGCLYGIALAIEVILSVLKSTQINSQENNNHEP